MPNMRIVLDGDGAFPELKEKIEAGKVVRAEISAISALPGGMSSGKPSIAILIDLPDGRTVFAETSLALFQAANVALRARYGSIEDSAPSPVAGGN